MNRYIDTEKLFAEIENLRKELPDYIGHLSDEKRGFARGQQYELTAIEEKILYIQQEQPEADLEKEIAENLGDVWNDTPVEVKQDMIRYARHFYELGKTARKEE